MAWGTAIAAIGGSLISGMMSKDASDEVSDASRASVAEQRRQFNQLRDDTAPYRETGANALYEMSGMLGLGGQEYHETRSRRNALRQQLEDTSPTLRTGRGTGELEGMSNEELVAQAREVGVSPDEYVNKTGSGPRDTPTQYDREGLISRIAASGIETRENPEYIQLEDEIGQLEQELQGMDPQAQGAESQFDISQTPGYQFRMDQGMNALNQSLAATGNRFSGRAAKAATRYGQGLASQEFSNRFNRLASLSGRGQAAVETSGQAGMQAAGNIGNAMMAGGRAQAAGIAGQNQAIQGGIGNYLSYQQNQNLLNNLGNTGYTGGNNMGTSYGAGTGSSPVAAYGR